MVVLDPCCGTGAYLIEVIRCIAQQLQSEGLAGALGAEILDAVCKRIVGFEILTAPFVIAQLQLYLLLAELDVAPGARQRPAIFLTNSLTGWGGPEQIKLNFPELMAEHEAARGVKREARIIVILGNPPYNRFAGAAMAEEADLVDHYKGIQRDEKGKQLGQSELFTRWGVRKHLLDDLYIRFIRLAEKRIGEVAEYGVFSFISNSSFLTGRSHPLMRESLLRNFHAIWVDNLHGNRLASERTPWGESCETMFSTESGTGIKVGTCISTYLKRKARPSPPTDTSVHHRDFWGRAADKRRGLNESLVLDSWPDNERRAAANRPEGPRSYEAVVPTEANRWIFAPRAVSAGFDSWPALDELFPIAFQGVNPNRGLEGSVIDTDREALVSRMRGYFTAKQFDEVERNWPALAEPYSGYEPRTVWKSLTTSRSFEEAHVLPYLLFPLDSRWLYYETGAKLLNRPRPEYRENLEGNEFLITVPQPRRVSETRPLLTSILADLHVHDRGSVCFPARFTPPRRLDLLASGETNEKVPNLAPTVWTQLKGAWRLRGAIGGPASDALVLQLFRAVLAIMHSPQYESDHKDGIAQGWARVPIPRNGDLLRQLADAGDVVGRLLDPQIAPDAIVKGILLDVGKLLGVPTKIGSSGLRPEDLEVTVSYFGAATGRWEERQFRPEEMPLRCWGPTTGDLYINPTVAFVNVPRDVWRYELGGYPVLKKWLGYRQSSRRGGRPLVLAEARHFRSMVQRIAALLAFHAELDRLYEMAAEEAFTANELGMI